MLFASDWCKITSRRLESPTYLYRFAATRYAIYLPSKTSRACTATGYIRLQYIHDGYIFRIGVISLGDGSCPAGVPVTNPMRCLVTRDSIHFFKIVKYSAITLAALMVAGIVTLMFLARGTGEDITGIVAPALLITLVSGAAAIVASVLLKREQKASDMRPSNDLPV